MDILFAVNRLPALIFGTTADDDDFCDRLNYRYTVAILTMFSAIVSNRQFSGRQIQCWVPAYFTGGYEEYTNHICYISNTYYIDPHHPIPADRITRTNSELKYYQWIPFILLFLSALFYTPRLFWKTFMTRSGLDIKDVVEAAISYKQLDKIGTKSTIMKYIVTMIDQYVDDPRKRQRARLLSLTQRCMALVCCMYGKFHGSYFIVTYLMTKLAFVLNTAVQFYLLKGFLGITFERYGFEIISRLLSYNREQDSAYFPKVTLCDFGVREPNHPNHSQPYTVQCVLPINLFNQQVFTLLWFWFATVAILNVYSLTVWMYRFLPYSQIRYITRRVDLIKSKDNISKTSLIWDPDACRNFVREYLKSDGVFILRMLCTNAGDYVTTEIIHGLWYYYELRSKQPIFMDRFSSMKQGPGDGSVSNAMMYLLNEDGLMVEPRPRLPPYEIITKTLKRRRRKRFVHSGKNNRTTGGCKRSSRNSIQSDTVPYNNN